MYKTRQAEKSSHKILVGAERQGVSYIAID